MFGVLLGPVCAAVVGRMRKVRVEPLRLNGRGDQTFPKKHIDVPKELARFLTQPWITSKDPQQQGGSHEHDGIVLSLLTVVYTVADCGQCNAVIGVVLVLLRESLLKVDNPQLLQQLLAL